MTGWAQEVGRLRDVSEGTMEVDVDEEWYLEESLKSLKISMGIDDD